MKEKQDERIVLPVEMPKSLRARLKEHAKEIDRSMAWCVREAIEEWLSAPAPGQVSKSPTTPPVPLLRSSTP